MALKNGFILPFSLVLATSILILATLILATGEFEWHRRRQALLRQRVQTTLQAEVSPLVNFLAHQILTSGCASAFQPTEDSDSPTGRTVALSPDSKTIFLHSESLNSGASEVSFRSPVSPAILRAEFTELSPPNQPLRMKLAWAAEDIALLAEASPPPAFWSLPSWFLAPTGEQVITDDFLYEQIGPDWDQLPWIAEGQPLPFSPDLSPALVPVPVWLGLRFGIFASGAIGSRERIVRIRYYLEGALWNPYNRPMYMHGGGGQSPVFQMALANLPEIRIHNLSRGVSTGWINLDAANNDTIGARGIHGWIRSRPVLEPGEVVAFLEPDPKYQPEGLARTLHPAFMVGPADHVEIEFRLAEQALQIALLNTGESDPLEAIRTGAGWFRAEDFPADFTKLDFPRADAGDQPFYLEAGSLAFRIQNARQQVVMDRWGVITELMTDPRKSLPEKEVLNIQVIDLGESPPFAMSQVDLVPLFSWPATRPADPLSATDLPAWQEAFRMGSAGATRINRLLDESVSWLTNSEQVVQVPSASGDSLSFTPAFPVNQLSVSAWTGLLARSAQKKPANGLLGFSAYMTTDANRLEDFKEWSPFELDAAAISLVRQLAERPCRSVADFFNRGLMAESIPANSEKDPLHALMPLRGWLRDAPPLRNHGSAWILHLAMIAFEEERFLRQSARVWLLETTTPEGTTAFTVQRFEWTNPAQHCLPVPR